MSASQYLSWGWLSITVPNAIIIGLMVVVFIAALFVRLPHGNEGAK